MPAGRRRPRISLPLIFGEDIKAFSYGSAAARAMVYFLLVVTIAWVFKMATMDRQEERDLVERPA